MRMELRLATKNDLPQIKEMYIKIINSMYNNNIKIWNDFYPCELFEEDIENNRLYILIDVNNIVASFSLCNSNDGEKYFEWQDKNSNALYIDRLGVNVDYTRKGIGGLALEKAIELTRKMNINYLRLLVVDINKPAINLYLKNGFKKVDGLYEEVINENCTLKEYGFEIKV